MNTLARRACAIFLLVCGALLPRVSAAQDAPISNQYGVVDDYADQQSQAAFTKAREAGIGWVRYDLYWNFANPAPGVYNWTIPDEEITRQRNAGLNIWIRVVWPPAWTTGVSYSNGQVPLFCLNNPTNPDCNDPTKTPSTANFLTFLRQAFDRYGDRVKYWGFGTEVHNFVFYTGGPEKFTREILAPGYQEAKTRGFTVVGPDEDVADSLDYLLLLEGVYGRWCDVISFHILRHSGGGMARLDNELKPVIDRRGGGRPVWLSEVGMEAEIGTTTDQIQAAWLLDQITGISARPWIQKSFIYRLKHVSSAPDFGILYANDLPKPAWFSIRDFIAGLPAPSPTPTPGPAATYTLSVVTSGSGTVTSSPAGVSCGTDCSETYQDGTVVTLTATAASGWSFAGWTGDADCADNAVAMTAARACTAQFTPTGVHETLNFNADASADVFLYHPKTGIWSQELGNAISFTRVPGTWSAGWSITAGEFNGDGRSDLFLYDPTTGTWFKAFSNGSGGFTYFSGNWSPGWTTLVLDLSGDGVSDVFLYNAADGSWFKCLSNGTGEFTYYSGNWSPGWSLFPADWNGDSRADLFLVNPADGQWFRATNDGGAGFTYYTESWSPIWSIYPGDFNGDGLTDVFLYSVSLGQWFVCTNNGTSFTYVTGTWAPGWSIDVGDLNDDGRADVFLYNLVTGQWFQAWYNGVNEFQYYTESWAGGWNVDLMDFNFDGRLDVLLYNPVTGAWFRCVNLGGPFAYTTGTWATGLTVVANRVTTP